MNTHTAAVLRAAHGASGHPAPSRTPEPPERIIEADFDMDFRARLEDGEITIYRLEYRRVPGKPKLEWFERKIGSPDGLMGYIEGLAEAAIEAQKNE